MSWYQSHFAENGLDDVKVVLLTNDKAHLDMSFKQGIIVYTGTTRDVVVRDLLVHSELILYLLS